MLDFSSSGDHLAVLDHLDLAIDAVREDLKILDVRTGEAVSVVRESIFDTKRTCISVIKFTLDGHLFVLNCKGNLSCFYSTMLKPPLAMRRRFHLSQNLLRHQMAG